jgi:hypothetical protein
MRSKVAAVLVTLVGFRAMAQPPGSQPSPGPTPAPATAPSLAPTAPFPATPAVAGSQDPAPSTATGRNGVLLGIELGLGRGLGDAERFGLFELGGQLGWTSHGRAALFATASLGVLGAGEAGLFASLGLGARVWLGRAFADVRVERMRVVSFECEEDCSAFGLNRYSAGVGVDAVRGPHGGMQLSLEVTRMAEVSALMLSIGGYVEL